MLSPPQTSSAVLLILFNRPDTTAQVFARIRDAQPPRLYIAADGPRENREGEKQRCDAARAIVKTIDWPCEVKTLFRDRNLGCKEAVASAISWFFEHESEGIILEDDCLPSPEFFPFCDILLEKYRNDSRVRHIGGSNLQHGRKRGDASYYFSRMTHVWGWASWRRAWTDYDKELIRYSAEELSAAFHELFEDARIAAAWAAVARRLKAGQIDTWDYQLLFTNMLQDGLSIIPNVNLVTNIGFRPDGTHTLDFDNRNANLPTGLLGALTHPNHFVPSRQADLYTLYQDLGIPPEKTLPAPAPRDDGLPKKHSLRKRLKISLKKRLGMS